MKPIKFDQANAVFAEHQDEYLSLPAFVDRTTTEEPVVTCWELSWWERLKLLWTGRLWWMQLTFGNPLQPQLPSVDCPIVTPKQNK